MEEWTRNGFAASTGKTDPARSFDDLIARIREGRDASRLASAQPAWHAVPRETENAHKVLDILEARMRADPGAQVTFSELAAAFGQTPKAYGRHLGQVASRIDAACVGAGLPLLGAFRIRLADGRVNVNALARPDWAGRRDALAQREATHDWTAEDFKQLHAALDRLPPKGASLIWQDICDRPGEEALRRALVAGRGVLR